MSDFTIAAPQRSNTFSVLVGELRVAAILESQVEAPSDLLTGIREDDRSARQAESLRGKTPSVTISCFLIETGSQFILVDTGLGGPESATTGRLEAELATLQVATEKITHVLFTHLHADHYGGIFNDAGKSRFPQAEFIAHKAEQQFCFASPVPHANAHVIEQYQLAQKLRPLLSQFRWVEGGTVLDSIELVHLPGHTPGHSGFHVQSGGQSLFLWGDIVHQPLHQFANPSIGVSFDVDPTTAVETRRKIMQEATTSKALIAGTHTDFPTFGHVRRDSEGFAFVPLLWTPVIAEVAPL